MLQPWVASVPPGWNWIFLIFKVPSSLRHSMTALGNQNFRVKIKDYLGLATQDRVLGVPAPLKAA